jgi:hypothetical protein
MAPFPVPGRSSLFASLGVDCTGGGSRAVVDGRHDNWAQDRGALYRTCVCIAWGPVSWQILCVLCNKLRCVTTSCVRSRWHIVWSPSPSVPLLPSLIDSCHEIVCSWLRTVVCSENRLSCCLIMVSRARVSIHCVVLAHADPYVHTW